MSSSNTAVSTSLTARIASLSPRLSYRLAVNPDDREEIFRLRHDAYVREGQIPPKPERQFRDEVDESENTYLFGIHVDGRLMSAIRVSVASLDRPDIPTGHVFPDILEPQIEAGKVIVDPSRFVVDPAGSRLHPELPYVTLRLAWIAMELFEADILLAAVRPPHVAFYRRFWMTQVITPPRVYPPLTTPVILTWAEYRAVRESVQGRYPFLASSAAERDRIFGEVPVTPRHAPAAGTAAGLSL